MALGFVFLFAMLTFVSIGTTSAGTIYMSDNYAKIQWAVDTATAGDRNYYESISLKEGIRFQEGAVQFIDSGQSLGDYMTRSVSLGDIDKDGDLDFVAGNSHSQPNKIYINNGAGVFSDSGQNLGSSGTYGVALGDVDNDGDLDLVVANYAAPNQLYMNDGSGAFADSGQLLGGSSYFTFSVA